MKTQNKKGFTIVELVIVIAVIAILAAVLIPTFINLTKKANESNTTALLRNLNVALANDKALNGEHKTAHSAVLAAKAAGYDLPTIAKEQTEAWIVWDAEKDEFVKEAEEGNVNQWKFCTSEESNGYSIYWIGEATKVPATVTVGFDAGEAVGIGELKYVNTGAEQTVTIRTNGFDTVLTIDAEKDVVNHYGEAKEINIAKVATSSYHEFGNVSGNINLAYGRVVLESGSKISNVVVKVVDGVTPTASTVKLTIADGADANLAYSEVTGVSISAEGAGAASIAVIGDKSGKVAAIGTNTYDTFEAAFNASKNGDTITLLADCVNDGELNLQKSVILDLNGNKLSSGTVMIQPNVNVEFKNGIFDSTASQIDGLGFYVHSNAGLRMASIVYSGACYGLFPAGDASFVDIVNCQISAIAGIATNASGEYSNNVKITIESSVIDASGKDSEIGVWINVPGTLVINNSIIKGNCQALMVRAGTATVTNSELVFTAGLRDKIKETDYMTGEKPWGSGNCVPRGALIVGDWSNGSYSGHNASCTLRNTKVSTDIQDWEQAVIVLARQSGRETILNYDETCTVPASQYVICNYSECGLKKGQVTVNGTVVQENEG